MRKSVLACTLAVAAVISLVSFAVRAADPAPSSPGRTAFEEKCGMCHRAMGMGTGLLARRYPKGQELLEARTNLTPELVTSAVRNGLGNMPRLSRAEVSDPELASIAQYLAKKTQ